MQIPKEQRTVKSEQTQALTQGFWNRCFWQDRHAVCMRYVQCIEYLAVPTVLYCSEMQTLTSKCKPKTQVRCSEEFPQNGWRRQFDEIDHEEDGLMLKQLKSVAEFLGRRILALWIDRDGEYTSGVGGG